MNAADCSLSKRFAGAPSEDRRGLPRWQHIAVALILAAAAVLAATAEPAHANDANADLSAEQIKAINAERIVIAGRQRMLAEGMAANLCFSDSRIARDAAQNKLYVMWNVFSWYHRGIVQGNLELGLPPETSKRVLTPWVDVDRSWSELKEIYEPVLAGGSVSAPAFDRAIALTDVVANQSSIVVAALRSVHAKDLGQAGFGTGLLIDLYERQRMLAERISKNVCLIARGDRNDARLTDLSETVKIFRASLDAFQNGLADLGVPPPPTPEIAESLRAAQFHWQSVAAFAFAIVGGMELGEDAMTDFASTMDLFNSNMTAALNHLVSYNNARDG